MKKAFSFLIILVLCFAILSGCGECEHEWVEANCKDPKTCTLCGAEEGKKLGHSWQEATCEEPQICTVCNKIKGEPLGHNYESVVLEPTMFEEGYTTHACLNCGHSYVDAHTEALGYEITEGTMVFKPDGVAYLYGSGGEVVKTYTGWMTEVYKIEDDYEINAGGFMTTAPWFFHGEDIVHVIIEDGVSPISTAYWFVDCYNLTSIYFGSDVQTLGEWTFRTCESLTDISFSPNSQLKTIERDTFAYGGYFPGFNIPNSVTHLGALPETDEPIVLHEGLLSIGDYALTGGDYLLPSTVTEIGCGNFASLTIPDNHPHFTVIDNCLIQTDTHTLVDTKYGFKIPTDGSVTALGPRVFQYNASVYGIDLPDCLITIGESAFDGSDLSEIRIPDSVTTIGARAFASCNNLTRVTLPTALTSISDGMFTGCVNLMEVVIPDGVTSIGSGAFSGCTQLTSIILPAGLEKIGDAAFATCWNLTQIILPPSLISIGDWAFAECETLTEIVLPEGLMHIGDQAFIECSIVTMDIPASVTEIGCNPFRGCENLTSITVADDNPEFYIFDHCLVSRAGKTLIVAFGKTEIPSGVEIIGDFAFHQYEGYQSIILPEGIIHIGNNAFYETNLISIELPESVETIGDDAFGNVETVKLPTTITFIGNLALQGAVTVYYAGTAEQWKNIEVKNQCAPGMEITVVCTDQTIYVGSWW